MVHARRDQERCIVLCRYLLDRGHAVCERWRELSKPAGTSRRPDGAGGNTDTFARVVAEKLKAPLGQQVIVDNRTGASGIVGSDIVAKRRPTVTRF
jgi:hypothetical protein